MKCRSKEVNVFGFIANGDSFKPCNVLCICTNDEYGKTLSIGNEYIQFTIPFEAVEEYFEGNYGKKS